MYGFSNEEELLEDFNTESDSNFRIAILFDTKNNNTKRLQYTVLVPNLVETSLYNNRDKNNRMQVYFTYHVPIVPIQLCVDEVFIRMKMTNRTNGFQYPEVFIFNIMII